MFDGLFVFALKYPELEACYFRKNDVVQRKTSPVKINLVQLIDVCIGINLKLKKGLAIIK